MRDCDHAASSVREHTPSVTHGTEADCGRQRRKWWRLYVHKVQKKYAAFVGILGFVYGFLIVIFALVGPYGPSDEPLSKDLPLIDRLLGAAEFLFVGETTWPAVICILIPAAIIFSLHLTHRLAGPLYRFEQLAEELKKGNLGLRIRLREGDDLQELAEALNASLVNLDEAFAEIRDREFLEREALRKCYDTMRTQPSTDQGLLKQVEAGLQDGERIETLFKRFQFSASRSQSWLPRPPSALRHGNSGSANARSPGPEKDRGHRL